MQQQKLLESSKAGVFSFTRYHRLNEIYKHLDFLSKETYSNTRVTVKTVGKSYEGRDIKTVTISRGDGQSRDSVFLDAGIHAREWIAPATALYWINQLVDPQSNYSKLLDRLDFVIQPVVNPDGYEYTFNAFRLWRKTRTPSGICQGVDANRNYDIHWNKVGSSNNSCADTYHGPSAFSEKESQTSRDVMRDLKANCKFFLTLHSYGNYLLYPWGYSTDLPENWKVVDEIARAGADAMNKATGVKYTVGSASNALYTVSGKEEMTCIRLLMQISQEAASTTPLPR